MTCSGRAARVPERIVLPRCTDFTESVLKDERMQEKDPLGDLEPETEDEDEGIEMVGADLSDAYCHFGVASQELKNCLAPALEEDEILVFCAVLFGFKGAPLIMGRLSAALARLWQSMIMRDGELQLYMDDPLFALIGPKSRRRGVCCTPPRPWGSSSPFTRESAACASAGLGCS